MATCEAAARLARLTPRAVLKAFVLMRWRRENPTCLLGREGMPSSTAPPGDSWEALCLLTRGIDQRVFAAYGMRYIGWAATEWHNEPVNESGTIFVGQQRAVAAGWPAIARAMGMRPGALAKLMNEAEHLIAERLIEFNARMF